jgi:hypothetical protein
MKLLHDLINNLNSNVKIYCKLNDKCNKFDKNSVIISYLLQKMNVVHKYKDKTKLSIFS